MSRCSMPRRCTEARILHTCENDQTGYVIRRAKVVGVGGFESHLVRPVEAEEKSQVWGWAIKLAIGPLLAVRK